MSWDCSSKQTESTLFRDNRRLASNSHSWCELKHSWRCTRRGHEAAQQSFCDKKKIPRVGCWCKKDSAVGRVVFYFQISAISVCLNLLLCKLWSLESCFKGSPSACVPTAPGRRGRAWAILSSVVLTHGSEPGGKNTLAAWSLLQGEPKCFQTGREGAGWTLEVLGAEGRSRPSPPTSQHSEHLRGRAELAERQQPLFSCLFAPF